MDREKVIKSLETCSDVYYGATGACSSCSFSQSKNCFAELVYQTIKLLKEQEPKTGHWIESAGDNECSACGAIYSDLYPDYDQTHYCPNCGAKMEVKPNA